MVVEQDSIQIISRRSKLEVLSCSSSFGTYLCSPVQTNPACGALISLISGMFRPPASAPFLHHDVYRFYESIPLWSMIHFAVLFFFLPLWHNHISCYVCTQ